MMTAAANTEGAASIIIRGVAYRYPHAATEALHEIDLTVPAGRIFGLLGPNGAGKSTLLGLLSGSRRLQSGAIQIGSNDLRQHARRIKQLSAIVPQEYAFYDDLSGRENLAYFSGAAGISRAETRRRIEHCAEICRLSDVLRQRAGTYSGGLKRRLNMAIGLLNEPKFLYLDEPTVGIDAESRQYIVQAIRSLRTAGVTVIYTSHYMEEVEQLCDAIAVIDHGRLVLQGAIDELLAREGQRSLTIHLTEPAPALRAVLAPLQFEQVDDREWHLEVGVEQVPDVVRKVTASGARIKRVQYGASRLEKIYLQLLANADAPDRRMAP